MLSILKKTFLPLVAQILLQSALGCATWDAPQPTVTSLPTIRTSTPMHVSEPTSTATPVPPILTPRPTPEPTFGPTLGREESQDALLELLHDNGGCDTPCVWGIDAGETSYEQSKLMLEHLGWGLAETPHQTDRLIEAGGSILESALSIHVALREAEGTIQNVHLAMGGAEYLTLADYYSLLNTLEREGRPTNIWISPPPDLWENRFSETSADVYLYYADKNLLLEYAVSAQLVGDSYNICPASPYANSRETTPDWGDAGLYAGPKNPPLTPEELTEPFGYHIATFIGSKYEVSQVLDMDIDAFYQDLLERGSAACYSIREASWP